MLTQITPKNTQGFNCDTCDFKCCKRTDWTRHLATHKHKMLTNVDTNYAKSTQKEVIYKYMCECGKEYKHRQSLWVHKHKCNELSKIEMGLDIESDSDPESEINPKIESELEGKIKNNLLEKDNLIEYLIKENQEFKGLIMELIKKDHSTNNITNNNNCNNVNNSFNLNLFLNETCKDAININEFVDNIQMKLSDLENFGNLGYVEGVSRILIKNLKDLDIVKRPIHCSDLKREVLYIKNEDKWTKEEDTSPIFKSAIKQVANKNIKQIPVWRQEHPTCLDPLSKQNDVYLKIVSNSMSGGSQEEMNKNYDKIIRNISKEVTIEKNINK
jgi:hypothetical protein